MSLQSQIHTILQEYTDKFDSNVISEIVLRLQKGTKSDIQEYVDDIFAKSIPLGPRIRICHNLYNLDANIPYKTSTSVTNNVFSSATSATTTFDDDDEVVVHRDEEDVHHVLNKWRTGQITPIDVFELLKQTNVCDSSNEIMKATVLQEGEYNYSTASSMAAFNNSKRFTLTIPSLPHLSIKNITTVDGESFHVAYKNMCNSNYLIIVDATSAASSKSIKPIKPCLQQTNSNPTIYWSYQYGTEDVSMNSTGSISCSDMTSRSFPLLLIGDVIHQQCYDDNDMVIVLEVDKVIEVDAITTTNATTHGTNDSITFALLLEGKLVAGALDSSTLGYNDVDGESEMALPDAFSDAASNPDSVYDDNPDRIGLKCSALCTVKKRYYVVFLTSFNNNIVIDSIVSLQQGILLDQRPNKILLTASKDTAIVSGTNSLLGVVKGDVIYTRRDLTAAGDTSGNVSFSLTNLEKSNFSPIIDDSYAPPGSSTDDDTAATVAYTAYSFEHTEKHHWHNATITCTSSTSTVAAALGGNTVMASGDNQGLLCIWSNSSGMFELQYSINLGARIEMIKVAASGRVIIAGLWDRLVLVGVNVDKKCLYIRCYLDIVEGVRCLYAVHFKQSHLQILRVTSGTTSSDACVCTGWLHSNLDAFVSRELKKNAVIDASCGTNSTTGNTGNYMAMKICSIISSGGKGNECNDPNTVTTMSDDDNDACDDNVYLSNNRLAHRCFEHEASHLFQDTKNIIAVLSAIMVTPAIGLLASVLDLDTLDLYRILTTDPMEKIVSLRYSSTSSSTATPSPMNESIVVDMTIHPVESNPTIIRWFCSESRNHTEFYVDESIGHSLITSLYLRYCSNKSIAVEHKYQEYLKMYGCSHLRNSNRSLRELAKNIRKIDETANIKNSIPRQICYLTGLREIYARRVGLNGKLPEELGMLTELRVISMGNNNLCGSLPDSLSLLSNLQRVVLHQNNFTGKVPRYFESMKCIINLAGNPNLTHGADVSVSERDGLIELYRSTNGNSGWTNKANWCTPSPVSSWYKVGVLLSKVHSIVMSSNGLDGCISATALTKLPHLKMIEFATMSGLTGPIPATVCDLIHLRRLCICRCGLTGSIPKEIGNLINLEELQLFGNYLTGTVPSSISKLSNLKLLSLGEYTGGNNFEPNQIPSCLSTLVNLEALFMANCRLKGAIPLWISSLVDLRQLDLQHNTLSSRLPNGISKLKNLLYLNLKDNNISGPLDVDSLKHLTKLNRLSLVHCRFDNIHDSSVLLQSHLPKCKIWV